MSKKSKKTRWGRVMVAWIAALACIFVLVPREKLPRGVGNNVLVVKAYSLKNSADKDAARIEPAAGAGYRNDDRRELDSLIGRKGH